jgi:transposase
MALPTLTPEQRTEALAKGVAARQARGEVKAHLKRGLVSLPDVLKEAAPDGPYAGMKVVDLLKSMPGVGEVRAKQIMARLEIAGDRRVRGLGSNQRAALEREFASVA